MKWNARGLRSDLFLPTHFLLFSSCCFCLHHCFDGIHRQSQIITVLAILHCVRFYCSFVHHSLQCLIDLLYLVALSFLPSIILQNSFDDPVDLVLFRFRFFIFPVHFGFLCNLNRSDTFTAKMLPLFWPDCSVACLCICLLVLILVQSDRVKDFAPWVRLPDCCSQTVARLPRRYYNVTHVLLFVFLSAADWRLCILTDIAVMTVRIWEIS